MTLKINKLELLMDIGWVLLLLIMGTAFAVYLIRIIRLL